MVKKSKHHFSLRGLAVLAPAFLFIFLQFGSLSAQRQLADLSITHGTSEYLPQVKMFRLQLRIKKDKRETVRLLLKPAAVQAMSKRNKGDLHFRQDFSRGDTLFLSFSPDANNEEVQAGVEMSFTMGQELKMKRKTYTPNLVFQEVSKKPAFVGVWVQFYVGKNYEEEKKQLFIIKIP